MTDFVNRTSEISRLSKALAAETGKLIVIYGRRRCGKSTLVRKVLSGTDVYFLADQREKRLQIESLATTIGQTVADFDKVVYPDWESLFRSLHARVRHPFTLCLDEFPYLSKNSAELPSVLQKIIDTGYNSHYHLILCGSAQQMMHNLAHSNLSPLYGRSAEIMNIKPMRISSLHQYLLTDPVQTIMEYGAWGGVPRYWEIRKESKSFKKAVIYNILDNHGILSEEPERLFTDDMRTSVQAYSIMALVGTGCHRLSEIAARLNKPATHLTRQLQNLIDLEYLTRETPFGVPEKTTKQSLYKIADPFLNFYFSFVLPNKSRLQLDLTDQVWKEIEQRLPFHLASIWEELCRQSVPRLGLPVTFNPAKRWWKGRSTGESCEIDVMAESADRNYLLIGEAKWSDQVKPDEWIRQLNRKAGDQQWQKKRIIKALFTKNPVKIKTSDVFVFLPADVIAALE